MTSGLGSIIFADVSLLRFPSQNRMFLVRKPYVLGTKTVRFWDGNHKRKITENRLLTVKNHIIMSVLYDFMPFLRKKKFLSEGYRMQIGNIGSCI